MVCPECESVFPIEQYRDGTCPHDGSPMEPLEGYYERHPERRDGP
ncbi:MAG: hypothetical protein AB7D51_09075 [Desulfovibrionaceae bacterium]